MQQTILGASMGNCVHVAGVYNFLKLAQEEGHRTIFLGPAQTVENIIKAIKTYRPTTVALGYRLTPSVLPSIIEELKNAADDNDINNIKWIFGGTFPTGSVARESNFFEKVFDGSEEIEDVINYIKGKDQLPPEEMYPSDLIERINAKGPYPLLRHHLGLPSVEDTAKAIEEISRAKVLDIISVAPDQNAQQFYFKQHLMDKRLDGAGGVPLRSKEDFIKLYDASRTGNFPLLRCYSGTDDVIELAQVLVDTINNGWCAVPLCWYNVLDGRGTRDVERSINENQRLMKWHGKRNIPVEVNESHHWSLRDAHDTIGVAAAYLAAYNAKTMGVKTYIAQYMFNVPAAISPKMDLAKMLAKLELIESLEDENFKVIRQVRTGLASMPSDLNMAKGQLGASMYMAMALKPHIVHVVGYSEAQHAAGAAEVIESCKIIKGIIKNAMQGLPNMEDNEVRNRKYQLIWEAKVILRAIEDLGKGIENPLADPGVIAKAIEIGILDAPHLKGNPQAKGSLETRVSDGACYAYDSNTNKIISESERIKMVLEQYENETMKEAK